MAIILFLGGVSQSPIKYIFSSQQILCQEKKCKVMFGQRSLSWTSSSPPPKIPKRNLAFKEVSSPCLCAPFRPERAEQCLHGGLKLKVTA